MPQQTQQLSSMQTRKSPPRSACQQAEAPQPSQMIMKGVAIAAGVVTQYQPRLSSIWTRKSPHSSACQQAEAPQSSPMIMKGAAIAASDAATAETASEFNVATKEPT